MIVFFTEGSAPRHPGRGSAEAEGDGGGEDAVGWERLYRRVRGPDADPSAGGVDGDADARSVVWAEGCHLPREIGDRHASLASGSRGDGG